MYNVSSKKKHIFCLGLNMLFYAVWEVKPLMCVCYVLTLVSLMMLN